MFFAAALIGLCPASIGDDGRSAPREGIAMAVDSRSLVGSWRKLDHPTCAASYPATLRFEENGLYRGAPEPPAQFTSWDVGTWRIEAPGKVRVSTANDAVVEYQVDGSADELRFTDPDGCRFAYRRDAPEDG